MPSEREGPCRAMVPDRLIGNVRCGLEREHGIHGTEWHAWNTDAFPFERYQRHPFVPPRPTLRDWLRDVALWLTPPGWVITLGLIVTAVALALLFFDTVPR